MAKSKSTPTTRKAATRVVKSTAKQNDGKIPAASFGARVDAAVQRRDAAQGKPAKQA